MLSLSFTFVPLFSIQAGEELGYDVVDTTSGDYQTGFAPYLYTIKDGMRWTPGKKKVATLKTGCSSRD